MLSFVRTKLVGLSGRNQQLECCRAHLYLRSLRTSRGRCRFILNGFRLDSIERDMAFGLWFLRNTVTFSTKAILIRLKKKKNLHKIWVFKLIYSLEVERWICCINTNWNWAQIYRSCCRYVSTRRPTRRCTEWIVSLCGVLENFCLILSWILL